MIIQTEFDIQDKVIINGDDTVVVTVQRIVVGGNLNLTYECCWFDGSGNFKENSFYNWQLTKKED